MPKLEDLVGEREQVVAEAEGIIKDLDGATPEGENAEKLRSLNERFGALSGDIESAEKAMADVDAITRARQTSDADRERLRPGMYGANGGDDGKGKDGQLEFGTPGDLYTAANAYGEWKARFPSGGPTSQMSAWSDAVDVGGAYADILGLRSASEKLRGRVLSPSKFRALLTSNDASVGELVRPDFRGLLEPGQVRPLTVRQLITVIPVGTDAISYVREASRVSNAAPTAEATAITGTSGTKPEGGLTFAPVTDTVKTIAEWVPATNRILADAPFLRGYIDSYLTDDIAIELEDQVMAGAGTGENFLGILNTPGIQTAGPPAGALNELDVIRRAKRLVRVNARTNATAVLINPEDAERQEQMKASGTGNYLGGGPFGAIEPRVWGLPYVESEAVPAGTAVVGDFRRAVLFDRQQTTISVGTANDDFLRNIVRVLAEMRAGFGVLRPAAFVAVDLVP